MKIAHLSDTHLGFRAFGRTTSAGINQREFDVMRTFQTVLNDIAELAPDVVVHSGDLFHVVRPSNATIFRAFKAIRTLQESRGGKPFILLGGNHDTPRMVEGGNILSLFGEIEGVVVVTGPAQFVSMPGLDLETLCVSSQALLSGEPIDWSPSGTCKHSILTLHGMASQALPLAGNFEIATTNHDKWTYVALGDYHVHQAFGKNVCYPGSTDFTSTNVWEETSKPKGWVSFDTEKPGIQFHEVATRPVIDLAPINAKDLAPEAIAESIRANAKWKTAELPIVRQRVVNVHPDVRGRVGAEVVRELSATCLNYQLDLLADNLGATVFAGRRSAERTLEHDWDDHVAKIQLPGGIERPALRALGIELLKEATELAADPA